MACYKPIRGYRLPDGRVVFSERGSLGGAEVPCGQCVGCRLERSRQWAMRCVHESKMHSSSCFVTLTYNDGSLPPGGSLRYRDYQLFMKRLRKNFPEDGIRFYMCGEYGESTVRPHYHALLFGIDFPDKKKFSKAADGTYLCTSKILEVLWPHGNSLIGEVTFESAAYVARYCMAKVTGSKAEDHYKSVNISTGEIVERVPEFNKMSLKPGIGATFLDEYCSDIYPRNYVVVRGVKMKPPKYYDKLFARLDSDEMDWLKYSRTLDVDPEDNTIERLEVRETVVKARISQYKRNLE